MVYRLAHKGGYVKTSIAISGSKSISNRLLIMQALCPETFTLKNIALSEDTRVLQAALRDMPAVIDIGHAGTAMRFLTAYLSVYTGTKILTGSERMQERPIEKVVTALQELGAQIKYMGRMGYPPLEITGSDLQGGEVSVDGSISSQYISALMMIAPTLPDGLRIRLKNHIISRPYIDLTAGLMQMAGVPVTWEEKSILIPHKDYSPASIYVEPDWSSASYWYAIAALSEQSDIFLKGFTKESLQGDALIAKMFEKLGIATKHQEGGIHLTRSEMQEAYFEEDFLNTPDMVQTFAVVLVLKKIPFKIHGTQSLRIKETDRIAALQTELKKFGADLKYQDGILSWDGKLTGAATYPHIETYHDHRMALAFAPAALSMPAGIEIDDPEVVVKSYPAFWEDLKTAGFSVEQVF